MHNSYDCRSLGAELQSEREQRKKVEETLTHTTTQLSNQKTELERYMYTIMSVVGLNPTLVSIYSVTLEHTSALEAAHTKCSGLVSELGIHTCMYSDCSKSWYCLVSREGSSGGERGTDSAADPAHSCGGRPREGNIQLVGDSSW